MSKVIVDLPGESLAKSFTLALLLKNKTFKKILSSQRSSWLDPQYGVNNYSVLCTVKAKKANKNLQQRTLSGFMTIPLY